MFFLPLIAAAALSQASPDLVTPDLSDPLAPARAGQIQCYSPDAATKTCNSLASYTRTADGNYTNTATILLSSRPAITLTTSTTVQLIGGAVCGAIRDQDISAGTVEMGGRAMPADQAQLVLAAVSSALNQVIDHQICTTYEPKGEGLVARATLDGVARPDLDQPILWVSPSDGYRVAP